MTTPAKKIDSVTADVPPRMLPPVAATAPINSPINVALATRIKPIVHRVFMSVLPLFAEVQETMKTCRRPFGTARLSWRRGLRLPPISRACRVRHVA